MRSASILLAVAALLVGCDSGHASMIDTGGVQAEIAQAQSVTPLPPGASFAPVQLQGGNYQPGSGTTMVQYQAACAWWAFWAEAISAADTANQSGASQMAEEIRTWQVYTGATQSLRDHWDDFIESAKLGDATGLVQEIELNCN